MKMAWTQLSPPAEKSQAVLKNEGLITNVSLVLPDHYLYICVIDMSTSRHCGLWFRVI